MLIYKDFITGDELLTDTYKMKLVDGVVFEVYGKHVIRKEGEIVLGGANPSAEEADEGTDENVESGIDVVLNQRLQECYIFQEKKDLTKYLKDYTKKLLERVQKNFPNEVDTFKTNMQKVAKELLGKFKDLQFFMGESMDPDGLIVFLEYREVDGEEVPIMIFLKYGMDEEKY